MASIRALQRSWHLARALRNELRWRPVTRNKYNERFSARTDPWGYEVSPFTLEKFQTAIAMLDEVRGDTRFERAWEIGCAEGAMTARLAPICGQLSAVDFIPLALQRASTRSQEFSNISYISWDLKADPPPGTFDLIVITDVLGSLGGQRDIRRARDKVVSALAPGGYLLYGDYLGELANRRIHDSWLGRLLLLRPRKILALVAAHPALAEVARRETTMHLLALFRNCRSISQIIPTPHVRMPQVSVSAGSWPDLRPRGIDVWFRPTQSASRGSLRCGQSSPRVTLHSRTPPA